MSEFLLNYKRVDPTTWVYLSSLLSLGLFFKFNRFWSVRNLDLILLILLAPGLLLVHYGSLGQAKWVSRAMGMPHLRANVLPKKQPQETASATESSQSQRLSVPADEASIPIAYQDAESEFAIDDELAGPTPEERAIEDEIRLGFSKHRRAEFMGYFWLLGVNVLLVMRLLIDPNMVRRPLLEPNLTSGGLIFICASSFVFLMANVIASQPAREPTKDDLRMQRYLVDSTVGVDPPELLRPGYILLSLFPSIPTLESAEEQATEFAAAGQELSAEDDVERPSPALVTATRLIAIISHLAIVLGIATVGYRHFDNMKMGIGAATLYLMLPYTAQMTGYISHSIPAALLVWAVVFYRRPATAGVFLGLAVGLYYYPLFLLPLWISFYWQRGLARFVGGVVSMLAMLVLILLLKSEDMTQFLGHLRTMFGFWIPQMNDLQGLWGLGWDPWYRVPVIALFIGISLTLAIWPAQKNLGTLISCSGAVMVATQFWHGFGGGLFMGWYLPLLLLTVFRPNLEDRIALSVLGEGWFPRRRKRIAA